MDGFGELLGEGQVRLAGLAPHQVGEGGVGQAARDRLVDAGTIRVIDMIVITKDAEGNIDAVEITDAEDLGPLTAIEAGLAGLLAEEDVAYLAAAMEPGSVAGVLVYENLWAAPFAAAARRAGGVLIADGRISPEDVVAAFAAIEELEKEEELEPDPDPDEEP